MPNDRPSTFVELAALDEACSKGPWAKHARLSGSENHKGYIIVAAEAHGVCDIYPLDEDGVEGDANAAFVCAMKGAAPRLLAELRALAERWEADKCYGDDTDEGVVAMRQCASDLRALLGEGEAQR